MSEMEVGFYIPRYLDCRIFFFFFAVGRASCNERVNELRIVK
jgi:hypothetical protein